MNRSFFPFFLSLYYRAQKYKHLRRLNSETISSRSLAALDVFEDQLDGNLFLTGDDICYVDLAVLYCLVELREDDNCPDFVERYNFPNLGRWMEMMLERPRLADYFKSERRMPRYKRPGYVYCNGWGCEGFEEGVSGEEKSEGWKGRTQ